MDPTKPPIPSDMLAALTGHLLFDEDAWMRRAVAETEHDHRIYRAARVLLGPDGNLDTEQAAALLNVLLSVLDALPILYRTQACHTDPEVHAAVTVLRGGVEHALRVADLPELRGIDGSAGLLDVLLARAGREET